MQTIFTGGIVAEKLMRNRGRTRNVVGDLNLIILRHRFEAFLQGRWKPQKPRESAKYAISLTSWSRRIADLQLTLLMLIDQDVMPAGINVWLTAQDRELIPAANREVFERYGVRFRDCPDYRSHKKWLPMVLSGHQAPFVVCDDDIFYPREWFGRLVAEDRDDAYVGCKCHRMVLGADGNPAPYAEWEKQIYGTGRPSQMFFTTGCGGEILHPERLNDAAIDWDSIQEHALFNDDIWLKAAHLARRISVYKTRYSFPCLELPGTDESGLLANHNTAQNDEQIKAVWRYFGIKALIKESS